MKNKFLSYKTKYNWIISRSSVSAWASSEVRPDDVSQQLQQGEAGVQSQEQGHPDRHQLEEGRRASGGDSGQD